MKQKLDKIWVGVLFGLVGPLFGFFVFYLITSRHLTLDGFIHMILNNASTHSGMISVSLIFNLIFFFGALRLDWYYAARGVILATLLYAPFVVFFKYG